KIIKPFNAQISDLNNLILEATENTMSYGAECNTTLSLNHLSVNEECRMNSVLPASKNRLPVSVPGHICIEKKQINFLKALEPEHNTMGNNLGLFRLMGMHEDVPIKKSKFQTEKLKFINSTIDSSTEDGDNRIVDGRRISTHESYE
ncbi:hypothetical protein L9F63_000962, partial [Diploptera punctata]